MIDKEQIERIKGHLKEYLEETGRQGRPFFTCVNPSHTDNTPSMSYNEKLNNIKCFSCNSSYDLISLYALDKGLDSKSDFKQILEDLGAKYNEKIKTTSSEASSNYQDYIKVSKKQNEENAKYILKCKKNIAKTDYLQKRGISEALVSKYNIGYDEKEKRVIFPLSKDNYVGRNTDDTTFKHYKPKGSTNELFNGEYLKDSNFKSVVWITEAIIDALSLEEVSKDIKAISLNSINNARQLTEEAKDNKYKGVFVLALDTDGQGLRACQELKEDLELLGINTFIFNSNSDKYNTTYKIRDIIEKNNYIEEENKYIDEEIRTNGQEWGKNREAYLQFRILGNLQEEYKKDLNKPINNKVNNLINKAYYKALEIPKNILTLDTEYKEILDEDLIICNKDINDYLLSEEEKLKNNVDYFNNTITQMLEKQALKTYEQENALNYLDTFKQNIIDQQKNIALSTGISSLDRAIEGGFYRQQLVILGAISSLGKTTLALQLADNIARQGEEVLIFSLEMSKDELIAKSLSRHSYLKAYDRRYTALALTTRDILTGKGSNTLLPNNEQRIEIYNEALEEYKKIANNIYISECNEKDDINIKTIEEKVKRHIAITNKRPFVVIDYLQIIQDTDKYLSDKQKTDKVLSDLKRLARDNDITILLISSLNRGAYTQEISLDSFKDSGNIEYTADLLIGLQAETEENINNEKVDKKVKEQINKIQQKDERDLTLKVLKNRNGRITDIKGIKFYAKYNYMYFKED